MEDRLRQRVDRAWSRALGVGTDQLWAPGVHVGTGAGDRVVVVQHEGSTRVLVPDRLAASVHAATADAPASDLLDAHRWGGWLAPYLPRVTGPFTHAYADDVARLEQVIAVEQIAPWRLGRLQADVTAEEWSAAGFDDAVDLVYGFFTDRIIAATANLRPWDGAPTDVGVLTHPEHRGLGYATAVAAGAARFAVVEHGVARCGVPRADVAAAATARRLGFEPYETSLTIDVSEAETPAEG